MSFRFEDPWFLALAPFVLLVMWRRSRRAARPTVLFSSLQALASLPRTLAQRAKTVLPWIEGTALLLLVLALSRPQFGHTTQEVLTEGVAIQLVIDRSGSMRELDLDPDPWDQKRVDRLDVVKAVVRDFVDSGGSLPGRPEDRVGLVTFAGYVQVHCPLTLTHEIFLRLLDAVEIPGARGERDPEIVSTALGDGLVEAVRGLEDVPARSRVVVLLSDGESNIGEATPEAAAQAAADLGIKVHTVGIGIPGRGLDEETLRNIAEKTHGLYFNARDASGIRHVYEEIDRLERVEQGARTQQDWNDQYAWVLVSGLLLLAVHRLLVDTRFRSLP